MDELIRHAELKDLPGLLALYRELRPQDPVLPADTSSAHLGRVLGHEGVYLITCIPGRTFSNSRTASAPPTSEQQLPGDRHLAEEADGEP
jgi:hypothetical protein